MRRNGDTTIVKVSNTKTPQDHLNARGWVVTESGCWEALGSRYPFGYVAMTNGTLQGAHRVAYTAWIGPIPKGLQVNHHCDNPPCINPEHLYAGSKADNAKDRADRMRHPNHVLTTKDKSAIVKAYEEGLLTHSMLGEVYGVSRSRVGTVLREGRLK